MGSIDGVLGCTHSRSFTGSQRAGFDEVFRRVEPVCRRVARRFSNDPHSILDEDDLTQEGLAAVATALPSYNPGVARLDTFANGVAFRACAKAVRYQKEAKRHPHTKTLDKEGKTVSEPCHMVEFVEFVEEDALSIRMTAALRRYDEQVRSRCTDLQYRIFGLHVDPPSGLFAMVRNLGHDKIGVADMALYLGCSFQTILKARAKFRTIFVEMFG